MTKLPVVPTLASLLAILALPSCVTHQKINYEDPLPVRFTSLKAATTFYDSHLVPPWAQREPEKVHTVFVDLPIRLPYRSYEIASGARALNESIRTADSNGDGTVSYPEARKFEHDRTEKFRQQQTARTTGSGM